MSPVDPRAGRHADQVRDHWWWRPGWRPGRRGYAFHLTFEGQPALYALAGAHRHALAGLRTVTLIPDRWLHLTMQTVDFTDAIPASDVRRIARRAGELLAEIPAFDVGFGEPSVTQEAVVMFAEPAEPVRRVHHATRGAIADVRGADRVPGDPARFRPHVSVAYLTADGSAAPYVAALTGAAPEPVRVRIDHVDLIEMHRDNRMYEWRVVDTFALAG
ncbi:2'-5' RNA ligase superfamily protein [Krasilnikovia cinnamomea]|uniref:2'-5' RNA ligase superfamily protein n=1 Tax=Krasilnikovia cinnamomea TaxID=349313 RepID=A0A4Q7ZQW9_9ACTN|nr:2'-5' RNA ligase family protein [Krasilnikovia cinnamomea]RZU53161.1 2'-5' RNA ligase superfamily protein [Krasilnikovia cinnamomea]